MSQLQLDVLVVDDEAPARRKIRRHLTEDPEVASVDEAAGGREAIERLERSTYDLLFLDVEMQDLSGFEVIARSDAAKLPATVFVTAHDQFAVRAFEVRALDFLLKPFDGERFREALRRAKEQIRLGKAARLQGVVQDLVDELRAESPGPLDRLLVKTGGRATFIGTRDVRWIEAAGNYVRVHSAAGEHMLRETLEQLLTKLDPARFARVHRSHAVNLDHVRELYHWSHGDYIVVLNDGTELRLSRRYRQKLPAGFSL